jgi:hypothetical protein
MALGNICVGNAPVSYGVFGQAAGGKGASPDRLLATIAQSGYEGSELGPPGFFGSATETREAFRSAGLSVIGSYVPLHLGLLGAAAFEGDLAQMRRRCGGPARSSSLPAGTASSFWQMKATNDCGPTHRAVPQGQTSLLTMPGGPGSVGGLSAR